MPQFSPVRNAHEDEVLRRYWAFYEPLAADLNEELREACLAIPAFAEIIRAMSPEENARENARSVRLQRAGIIDGNWDEYLVDLQQQGTAYARMGVAFSSWFDLIAVFRDAIRTRLERASGLDPVGTAGAIEGMHRLLDIAMAGIGEAYLSTKEEIIRDQQAAIREISTPVLQIRDQVLILPIVGLVDTHRARQITESVLKAIRARRAKAVVMDVTGVPVVDSRVAKHLAQTCESARLMGAVMIVTGISQEIAQTLVTIGADLAGVRTLGDLQSGVEEVERLLGLPPTPVKRSAQRAAGRV